MKIELNKQDEIDRLEEKQNRLLRSKEERTSKINFINNKRGAKIKRLEEKMFIDRTKLDKFIEKVDLEIEKNAKLIIASAEYAQRLGDKYSKIRRKK